jgi:predicted nucleic-acid-binding protein
MTNHASFALDTSCVLRLIVGEPLTQFALAASFFEENRAAGCAMHVCDLVLAESYFALHHYYKFSKSDALVALRLLVGTPPVVAGLTAREVLDLPDLATAKPGFVDRLIHGDSHSAGHALVTFEKATAKLPGTLILT